VVAINVTVYGFAISTAGIAGSMHLRTTWTLNDFGTPADYQAYGDLMLGYRMCPDNIYRNGTPDISILEHWYSLGLNTFSVYKADNLWHPGDLQNQGVDAFFTALGASSLGAELRNMAQFYGYDEKYADGSGGYGDSQGPSGMRATYGTIKAAYGDVPTTTTCRMYLPPWADPVGDMTHYNCDWICAEQSSYTYADGQLLRGARDPVLPNNQNFQYWVYRGDLVISNPFVHARTTFWSVFQQRADGYLYYSVNAWPTPVVPIDPANG